MGAVVGGLVYFGNDPQATEAFWKDLEVVKETFQRENLKVQWEEFKGTLNRYLPVDFWYGISWSPETARGMGGMSGSDGSASAGSENIVRISPQVSGRI